MALDSAGSSSSASSHGSNNSQHNPGKGRSTTSSRTTRHHARFPATPESAPLPARSSEQQTQQPHCPVADSAQPCRVLYCQILGCRERLVKSYCIKKKACTAHLHAEAVQLSVVDHALHRFCQQCGKFELLSKFEDNKRSCRVRLAKRRSSSTRTPPLKKPNLSRPPAEEQIIPAASRDTAAGAAAAAADLAATHQAAAAAAVAAAAAADTESDQISELYNEWASEPEVLSRTQSTLLPAVSVGPTTAAAAVDPRAQSDFAAAALSSECRLQQQQQQQRRQYQRQLPILPLMINNSADSVEVSYLDSLMMPADAIAALEQNLLETAWPQQQQQAQLHDPTTSMPLLPPGTAGLSHGATSSSRGAYVTHTGVTAATPAAAEVDQTPGMIKMLDRSDLGFSHDRRQVQRPSSYAVTGSDLYQGCTIPHPRETNRLSEPLASPALGSGLIPSAAAAATTTTAAAAAATAKGTDVDPINLSPPLIRLPSDSSSVTNCVTNLDQQLVAVMAAGPYPQQQQQQIWPHSNRLQWLLHQLDQEMTHCDEQEIQNLSDAELDMLLRAALTDH